MTSMLCIDWFFPIVQPDNTCACPSDFNWWPTPSYWLRVYQKERKRMAVEGTIISAWVKSQSVEPISGVWLEKGIANTSLCFLLKNDRHGLVRLGFLSIRHGTRLTSWRFSILFLIWPTITFRRSGRTCRNPQPSWEGKYGQKEESCDLKKEPSYTTRRLSVQILIDDWKADVVHADLGRMAKKRK